MTLLQSELELTGSRILLRPLNIGDFGAYKELRARCSDWLSPWEPVPVKGQPDASKERRAFAALCGARDRERQLGTGFGFAIVIPDHGLAGVVNLSGIQRGPFQSSYLGYWIDEACAGQGYVPEAVAIMLRFAFEEAGLHRVQVAVIPRNHASRRVVEKLGLREEGLAERYLQIAGVWEDHIRYAMTVEEWADRGDAISREWL